MDVLLRRGLYVPWRFAGGRLIARGTPDRCVEAEVLDGLAADDPRGRRSRRDLQRVHVVMRTVAILQHAVGRLGLARPPLRILELGAGDGLLLLRFAKAQRPAWNSVELTLLDRIDVVSEETREQYRGLGWQVMVMRRDALEWADARHTRYYDLCFANLFLHHFRPPELATLLGAVAAASRSFVACEPRRSRLAWAGSRLIGLLGTNEVTRADAITSVAAGFSATELTAAWPAGEDEWHLQEYAAWPFTHCLAAAHTSARAMPTSA